MSSDGRTTITIDSELRGCLDTVVKADPRYRSRNQLANKWLWDKIIELGYFDSSRKAKAVGVEG